MIIAVAYDNGSIFLHFGHCPIFAIYETNEDETEVVTKRCVETKASGHQAVADFMASLNVDAVICGNIGTEARRALAEHGIIAYAGFEGSADTAADMLVAGDLPYLPDGGACAHHEGGGCCCHGGDDEGESCGCHHEEGGGGCCCHGEE